MQEEIDGQVGEVNQDVETETEQAEGAQQEQSAQQQEDGQQQERDEQGRFKPGGKVQQRIDELTRARHEAEREAAYWRTRAESSGGKDDAGKTDEPALRPTPDQFENYIDYIEALTDWKADQGVKKAMSARDSERASEAQTKAIQSRESVWVERQNEARTMLPDYDEVVGLSTAPIAPHLAETLLDSDRGPEVAYYLAKNPDLLKRINDMSHTSAAREIGKIEALLEKQQKPAVKMSGAPAPTTPIGGAGKTNATSDPAKMTMEQYKAFRKKQGARWAK